MLILLILFSDTFRFGLIKVWTFHDLNLIADTIDIF